MPKHKIKGNNKNISLTIFIYLVVIFVFFMVFPTKIKIQFSSNQAVGAFKGYTDDKLVTSQRSMLYESESAIYWGNMEWSELRKTDTLKFSTAEDQLVELSNIKVAIGNHVLINDYAYYQDGGNIIFLGLAEEIRKGVSSYWAIYCLVGLALLIIIRRKQSDLEKGVAKFCQSLRNIWHNNYIYLYAVIAATFGGTIAGKLISFVGIDLGPHYYEMLCFLWAMAIVFCLLKIRTSSIKMAVIGSVGIAAPLWCSAERLLTFMTVDEPKAINCMKDFPTGWLQYWLQGTSKVSHVLLGTTWKYLPNSIANSTVLAYYQVAKAMHWLWGILFVILIVDCAQRRILDIKKDMKPERITFQYVVLFNSMLLLPIMELGLKNYNNYDMFSMLFAVYGFEWIYLGLRDLDLKAGWFGLILETLALVEKMNSFVLYILAGAVVILIYYVKNSGSRMKVVAKSLFYILLSSVGCMAVVHVYVICFLARDNIQILSWSRIITDWLGTTVFLVRKIRGTFKNIAFITESNVFGYGFSIVLILFGMLCCFYLIYIAYSYFKTKNHSKAMYISMAITLGIMLFRVGTMYLPSISSNGTYNYLLGLLNYMFNAIPSIYLLLIIFLLIFAGKADSSDLWLYVFLPTGIIGFLASFLAIRQYASDRYMNMYICIVVLIVVILSLRHISERFHGWRNMFVAGLLMEIVLLADVVPSAPAYTVYYPVWNRTIYKNKIGIWAYWGDQISIVGEKIVAYCQENDINPENVNIYMGYPGEWMNNVYRIRLIGNSDWSYLPENCGTSDSDFYLYDSQAVMRGWVPKLPEGVEPLLTVKYKGAVTARVYQGSQLVDYFAGWEG